MYFNTVRTSIRNNSIKATTLFITKGKRRLYSSGYKNLQESPWLADAGVRKRYN